MYKLLVIKVEIFKVFSNLSGRDKQNRSCKLKDDGSLYSHKQ